MGVRRYDHLGQRFGRLLVVSNIDGGEMWRCRCDCGAEVTVRGGNLRHNTQSCGCYRREVSGQKNRTHGMRRSPEYNVWRAMLHRCHNPKNARYCDYGGRGIAVCAAWRESFYAFIADMGCRPSKQHSIDRIDNDLGYSPTNCRWTTKDVQVNNSRRNVHITHDGVRLTIAQWERRLGLPTGVLRQRIWNGWDHVRALTTPRRGTHV